MSIKSTEKENLQRKALKDFTSYDTIYIQKNVRGFAYNYLCQFVKVERGIVMGRVLDVDKSSGAPLEYNDIITARASRCYLYGRFPEDEIKWNFCHWFKDSKTPLGA